MKEPVRKIDRKQLLSLFWKSIIFGFFGSLFVLSVLAVKDFVKLISLNRNGFMGHSTELSIAVLWVFFGMFVSFLFWNLLFRESVKYSFGKWFFVLITASVLSILMQIALLIHLSDLTTSQIFSNHLSSGIYELTGLRLMIELFVILVPYSILFANYQSVVEKIKSRKALK